MGGVGLHPGMKSLKTLFDGGEVAVIQGAGYPNANQSHFRSMDIWQTAVPERRSPSAGWAATWTEISDDDANALYGVAFDTDMPHLFRGERSQVPAIPDLTSYQFRTDPNFPQDRSAQINAIHPDRLARAGGPTVRGPGAEEHPGRLYHRGPAAERGRLQANGQLPEHGPRRRP